MKIEATTAQGANPAPLAHQSHVAEQGRLDRKHVEPRHVATWVTAHQHQHLQPVIVDVARVHHIGVFVEDFVPGLSIDRDAGRCSTDIDPRRAPEQRNARNSDRNEGCVARGRRRI